MTLYLVSTPIGNLGDLSDRSIAILSSAPLILTEDTRTFAKLQTRLPHRCEKQRVISFHKFNESQRTDAILSHLQKEDAVLISDAGTPCVCDPGRELVASCHSLGIQVRSVGTLCAFVAAFSCSGFKPPLLFHGFSPKKKSELESLLSSCFLEENRLLTHCFYVSKHQIESVIESAAMIAERNECRDCVLHLSKEISKLHEAHHQGRLLDPQWIKSLLLEKGEWVLLLKPSLEEKVQCTANAGEERKAIALAEKLREEGLSLKRASKIASSTFGSSSNGIYRELLERENLS